MIGLNGIFGSIKEMPYKTKNDAWRPLAQDPSSHALIRISHQHKEVHDGNSYWLARNATLGNAENITIAFTTPATPEIHMILEARATATGTFYIYEGLTSYSNGAATLPKNRHRSHTNTSSVTDPQTGNTGANAITLAGGTAIWQEIITSAFGAKFDRRNGEELILKPSTKYALRVTNGVAANTVTLLAEWYEHTPKD